MRTTLSLLLAPMVLLAACQPVARPTTPETAVAGAGTPVGSATVAGEAAETGIAAPPEVGTTPQVEIVATAPDPEIAPGMPSTSIVTGADVIARITRGLSPNSCEAGSNSERWRQRYAGNEVAFARRIEEVLPLIDFVSTEVERAGLPVEFVFIPLVESWYQPAAIGPGGPAGMWQMIASTARNHGIKIKPGYDGRLSPVESTRAALSYLTTLQGIFGNWQSIVMAYNAGEGRLQHAFRRAGGDRTASAADRRPQGLSNITYDYVAKLQALSCLFAEPSRQGLRLPTEASFERLVPLLIDEDINSLAQFARRHGKDAHELRQLNPAFRHGHVSAHVPRLVLAPPGAVPQGGVAAAPADEHGGSMLAVSRLEPGSTPDAIPDQHRVRPGESLWSIARRYHVPIEQLRRANGLGKKSLVHPGQMLRLAP